MNFLERLWYTLELFMERRVLFVQVQWWIILLAVGYFVGQVIRALIQEELDMKKEIRKCLRCEKVYEDYPATSRRDNSTEICSKCGTEEAMVDFYGIAKVPYDVFCRELRFCADVLKLDRKQFASVFTK